MSDSIFTKIIRGEIPSHKVHEDDKTYAFMDIHPIQPGQVVVVPKKQVEFVWDLDAETYQAVMAVGQTVAQRLKTIFPDKVIGMQIEGLEVPHAHLKIFPFKTAADFHHAPDPNDPDHAALAELAKKLAF